MKLPVMLMIITRNGRDVIMAVTPIMSIAFFVSLTRQVREVVTLSVKNKTH